MTTRLIIILIVVLICEGNSATGALIEHSKTAESVICSSQCYCSLTEMLCPGANITEVLNHGIVNRVEHLDWSNTNIDVIPTEVAFMSFCVKLNLSSNRIRSIERNTIGNLWNLQELVMNDNAIADIADVNLNALFNNNKNIKVLNLSGNPFPDLGRDPDTVLYSESLEVLDVSRCRITSLVGPLVLNGLRRLTYLNLSGNPLAKLDMLFSGTLKVLSARGCMLGYLGQSALVGFHSLEVFDVGLNDQLYVDSEVLAPKLRSLDASMCSIRVPNLSGMTELRSAFLDGNRIKRIDAYQFVNNTKLLKLDLSNNHVQTVNPFAFHGMTSLVHLDLSSNKIADISWETTVAAMPSLEMLDLSHNLISRLGCMRSNTLRRLDLSHCSIRTVPNATFARLGKLTDLVLSNNPLQTLSPGSLNSTSLSQLDLGYCRISHLAANEFARSPELVQLRLTGNRLVTLKNGTFNRCPKLKHVYLDDNPWRCDCYSVDFAYMTHLGNATVKQNPVESNSPRCLTPDNVTGVPWFVACANGSTYGRDNRKNFSMAVGVILILCVSGMMAICVAVHENVKTRQAMRRRRQMDGEYGDADARDGGGGGGGGSGGVGSGEYYDEFAAAAESLRKLSQLPSYDEAVALPRPAELAGRRIKRHSCTQTEQAEEADELADTGGGGGGGGGCGHRDPLQRPAAVEGHVDRLLQSSPGFRITQL